MRTMIVQESWGSPTAFGMTTRPRTARGRSAMVRASALLTLPLVWATALSAQITPAEYAARRDSLAAHIENGIVIAFGGRTPITDFGPFFQNPAFHYLTNFDEPDAALVMVARGGKGTGTLFLMPIDPRRAFYYGRRPDSASVPASHGTR